MADLHNWKIKHNPIFIYSSGRTGTVSISKLLDKMLPEPKVVRHEPSPDLFNLGTAYMSGSITGLEAAKQLADERHEYLQNNDTLYVEVNPKLAWLSPILNDVFPNCVQILITRDVRTFISSKSKNRRAKRTRRRVSPLVIPDDPFASVWHKLSSAQKMAWTWNTLNDMCLRYADFVFHFEKLFPVGDLFNPEEIYLLARSCGEKMDLIIDDSIPAMLSIRYNKTAEKMPPWNLLPRDERAWILGHTQYVRDLLGY